MTPDFMAHVMPVFLLNMEKEEFEEGRWRDYPPLPMSVSELLDKFVPEGERAIWRFASCDAEGRRARLGGA